MINKQINLKVSYTYKIFLRRKINEKPKKSVIFFFKKMTLVKLIGSFGFVVQEKGDNLQ
jgi:hypothetical protein